MFPSRVRLRPIREDLLVLMILLAVLLVEMLVSFSAFLLWSSLLLLLKLLLRFSGFEGTSCTTPAVVLGALLLLLAAVLLVLILLVLRVSLSGFFFWFEVVLVLLVLRLRMLLAVLAVVSLRLSSSLVHLDVTAEDSPPSLFVFRFLLRGDLVCSRDMAAKPALLAESFRLGFRRFSDFDEVEVSTVASSLLTTDCWVE